jgi:hypothetical protein
MSEGGEPENENRLRLPMSEGGEPENGNRLILPMSEGGEPENVYFRSQVLLPQT